jgi:hypothetical protein
VPKDPPLERDHLRKTAAALEASTGRRPAGTRSSRCLASPDVVENQRDIECVEAVQSEVAIGPVG